MFSKVLSQVLTINLKNMVKYSISSTKPAVFSFKTHFTLEQQSKILEVLNNSTTEHLSRYKVSQNRIKGIESWRNKKGPFTSLADVLEVDGLGEKVLERICDNIIKENVSEVHMTNGSNKRLKQLVTPQLSSLLVDNLNSVVGIHLSAIGMSWAKLSRDRNQLYTWNFQDFTHLPQKMFSTDTFDLAISVLRRIPAADIYIFESSPTLSPQGQTKLLTVSSYNQLSELTAMLIALLNTSINHNATLANNPTVNLEKTIENRVYFIRAKVPARLFRTLVGNERVAAVNIVTKLIEYDESAESFAFPCTPVMVEPQMKKAFMLQSPPNKELLGQALMLVATFMDLCIYKNAKSFAAIAPNRKS